MTAEVDDLAKVRALVHRVAAEHFAPASPDDDSIPPPDVQNIATDFGVDLLALVQRSLAAADKAMAELVDAVRQYRAERTAPGSFNGGPILAAQLAMFRALDECLALPTGLTV